ncbi:hypothetical protein [Alloalcanivorax venustensis]|uniref:hypothetical protein n=1 Tax=Alloalcanivorax venustensis TaxID=172371 RepID=UPI003513B2BB
MIQIIRTFLSLTLLASALALGRAAEKGKGLGDGHHGWKRIFFFYGIYGSGPSNSAATWVATPMKSS